MQEEIERTILVKNEVFMYKIPPRSTSRGYRASEWSLSNPDWNGRLRCVSKGIKCEIRLEDKTNGQLFASCPVESYPGTSVEAVTDSSRYFVLCIQDSGRRAYIGIGFSDRSDSFDLNVALQDHFKWVKMENSNPEPIESTNKLDLAFKEGQTIRINIPKNAAKKKPANTVGNKTNFGILPPPPSSTTIKPKITTPSNEFSNTADLLGGFADTKSQDSNSWEKF